KYMEKFSANSLLTIKSTVIALGAFGGISSIFIFGSNPGKFNDFLKIYLVIFIAFVGSALYEKWCGLIIEDNKYFYGSGLFQRRNKIEINSILSLLFYTNGRGSPMLAVYYKNPGATYKNNKRFWIAYFIPSTIDEIIQKIQSLNPEVTINKSPDFIKRIQKEQQANVSKPWGIYYLSFLYFFTTFSIVFVIFLIIGLLT
ncbi:MAG: hypothetical protein M1333_00440, partial [Patescibacteria group bacterium]|nr:hypothetical protein [Patescibacteria group bacterium]